MPRRKIIVIGGGPAGLMAAGQAAEAGAEAHLYEKMKRPGRKLGITGKGRCNLTNSAEIDEFIEHFGATGPFLRQAFHRFCNIELIDFFQTHGLTVKKERGGRIFPAGDKASNVIAVLLKWLKRCNVRINTAAPVEKLLFNNGQVTGIITEGRSVTGDAVILTTGGASYPATGSTGDGYALARSAGHTIVPIRPALVPLETKEKIQKKMVGLILRNIRVSLFVNKKKQTEAFGELAFTEFGLSGPVILSLSGSIVDALRKKHTISVALDLKPALDEKKLDARLLRDCASRSTEEMHSVLRGLLPREMVSTCLKLTKIPPGLSAGALTAGQRKSLRIWLKDFRLNIIRARPLSEAIVTAGGVNTQEVDPRSMQSRIINNLYIAGELLDVHADTGGYNLQAAFSTGLLAGRSAAKKE
ncbi:MAG: NAD(P)/FAD-dependent oxidoreductase [Deltaproteobacteria bacterium]|nr:NAD(P)/FAD-dependent oxidoreductase [Deltaproteobacteria bacterium]